MTKNQGHEHMKKKRKQPAVSAEWVLPLASRTTQFDLAARSLTAVSPTKRYKAQPKKGGVYFGAHPSNTERADTYMQA